MQGDTRPETYVVERGDTLFGIALDFGLDYRELAAWNGIPDASRILVGQRLRLLPPEAPDEPEVKPLAGAGAAEVESLGAQAGRETAAGGAVAATVAPAAAVDKVPTLSEPQANTLPWSEKALAQLGGGAVAAKAAAGEPKPDGRTNAQAESKPDAKAEPRPDARAQPKTDAPGATRPEPKPDAKPDAKSAVATGPLPAAVAKPADSPAAGDDWVWPARGALAYRFGDSGTLKGLGIAGKAGSPVVAAAPGRVVYSGSGLRGYGKLVIIKHGEEYLTVYAHNRALLVKEGEQVRRGQRIAEMGDTDSDRVALHFELRRFGKPVDPLSQLPGERPPS